MNSDTVKGTAIKVVGRTIEAWGKMTGSWRLRAVGKGTQGVGSARVTSGRAKDVFRNARNRAKGR